MGASSTPQPSRGALLSEALKGLRKRRGLKPCEMASALHMAPRSFEYFESGRSRINLDRLHQAAEALGADPYALLLAVDMGSPRFAMRCAENKLVSILVMALQEFDQVNGDDIALLDPRTVMAAFTQALDELSRHARERADIVARRPGPRR